MKSSNVERYVEARIVPALMADEFVPYDVESNEFHQKRRLKHHTSDIQCRRDS
jgi:hypothetical protein